MKNLLLYGLIATIALILVFPPNRSQNKPITATINGKQYDIIKYVVDTQYYPLKSYVKVKGDTIKIDTVIYVNGTIEVDTVNILKDYLAKKVYLDTLRIDSIGYIAVRDTIRNNTIFTREYFTNLRFPTIRKTTIVAQPKKLELYGGLTPAFDKQNIINSLGISLIVKTKADRVFSLGLGIDHDANTVITTGIYWKIK